jgi:hypothetical protein
MARVAKKKDIKDSEAEGAGMKADARGKRKLPMHIGVRNPYALAETKKGHPIGWKKWTQYHRDKIFHDVFGRSFRDLFDPDQRSTSPVYACKATDPCPSIGWANSSSWMYQDVIHGENVVQGAACDCYFIAALSSVAWTCRSGVIKKDELTNPSCYTIMFYDDTANPPIATSIGVSKNLPVLNNNLVYADSSTVNETWPSYYEKAYAHFYSNLGANQASVQIDVLSQQVLSSLCNGGNPLASLFHLAKPWGYTTKTAKYPATDYADAAAMWTAVNKLTLGNKTKYPMVAWTYIDAPTAAQYLQMTPADWLQKWADYAGDKIIAQHSYSIFGTYQDATTGKMYILLRNPFGPDQGNPAIQQLYTGTWTCANRFYKPGGSLNSALRPATGESSTTPIELSKPDGIFALEAEAFRAYFEAFGWVS